MAACFGYLLHCSSQEDGLSELYPLRSYSWWNWAVHLIVARSAEQTFDTQTRLDSLRLFNSIVYPVLYKANAQFSRGGVNADWLTLREAAQ